MGSSYVYAILSVYSIDLELIARLNLFTIIQGPHCTGKTGKMTQKISVRESREFRNFAKKKNTGNLYAQAGNSLILKIKDIVSFAWKITIFFLVTEGTCKVSLQTNH